MKYFTKSVFKLCLECPTKAYYYSDKNYGNVDMENEFLQALAEGGFQVGELARVMYKDGIMVDTKNHLEAVEKTKELLKQKNVVIFEAAFLYKNCFVRVDILEKIGDEIKIIEVKSKSFNSRVLDFITTRRELRSEWVEYIADITFQYYVVKNSVNFEVIPYLMLADKAKTATVNGLNQIFQLDKNENQVKVNIVGDVNNIGEPVLSKVEVLEYFNFIYADFHLKHKGIKLEVIEKGFEEINTIDDKTFIEVITNWADKYSKGEKIVSEIGDKCFKCQFRYKEEDKKSGFKECFDKAFEKVVEKEIEKVIDEKVVKVVEKQIEKVDYSKPMIDEINNFRGKGGLLLEKKIYLSDLKEKDILKTKNSDTQLRQWLQVSKTVENDKTPYLNKELLEQYVNTFVYPLHFIDFETNMVAIPFYEGQTPYEQIAFQFSHHVMYEDGKVEHKGQFLFNEVGKFPNFQFVRALKKELEVDNGTIFRYAPHENTVLNQIKEQLVFSAESDKEELIEFINSITYNEFEEGNRSMVDMLEIVKKCYYHIDMKGSNSIKYVLPSVLNSSEYIKDKYSKPIYGKGNEINSLNYEKDFIWITFDESGKVINPYKLLPDLSDSMKVNNGADAMMAYTKMQFTNISDEEKVGMYNALLKYCELDTLAMVIIMEYWLNELK